MQKWAVWTEIKTVELWSALYRNCQFQFDQSGGCWALTFLNVLESWILVGWAPREGEKSENHNKFCNRGGFPTGCRRGKGGLAILVVCLDLLYLCWLWSYFWKFVLLLLSVPLGKRGVKTRTATVGWLVLLFCWFFLGFGGWSSSNLFLLGRWYYCLRK